MKAVLIRYPEKTSPPHGGSGGLSPIELWCHPTKSTGAIPLEALLA